MGKIHTILSMYKKTYMLNIVWDFQTQFYKIAIVSQCHKPKSADLPQVIEQVQQSEIFWNMRDTDYVYNTQ